MSNVEVGVGLGAGARPGPASPEAKPTEAESTSGGSQTPEEPEPSDQVPATSVLGTRILELTEPMLTGADVEAWQRIIQTHPILGDRRLEVSGVFDDLTDTVTRLWQGERGLVVDGIVGPASLIEARQVTEPETDPRPLPFREWVDDALARRRAKADERVRRQRERG